MKSIFDNSSENSIWSKSEIDEISKNVAQYVMDYVSEKENERKAKSSSELECEFCSND